MTFNMMRSQRVHPKISTYTEIHEAFSFTNTPLAPICIKELVRENSNVRLSWATHGMDGYYLGPDMEHNRCYQVYTHQKRGKRVVDIVELPPQGYSNTSNFLDRHENQGSRGSSNSTEQPSTTSTIVRLEMKHWTHCNIFLILLHNKAQQYQNRKQYQRGWREIHPMHTRKK